MFVSTEASPFAAAGASPFAGCSFMWDESYNAHGHSVVACSSIKAPLFLLLLSLSLSLSSLSFSVSPPLSLSRWLSLALCAFVCDGPSARCGR